MISRVRNCPLAMVLLSRAGSEDQQANGQLRTREIITGSRVAVLNGRHFPSFGAGDEGVVVRVDHEARKCDVMFTGRNTEVPVALRHLREMSEPLRENDEEDQEQ